MVELQIFLEGLSGTVSHLAGDFLTSVGGFIAGLGGSVRDILAGISLSK